MRALVPALLAFSLLMTVPHAMAAQTPAIPGGTAQCDYLVPTGPVPAPGVQVGRYIVTVGDASGGTGLLDCYVNTQWLEDLINEVLDKVPPVPQDPLCDLIWQTCEDGVNAGTVAAIVDDAARDLSCPDLGLETAPASGLTCSLPKPSITGLIGALA